MELFDYLMAKKGHNTGGDLFSYLLGKNAGGSGTYTTFSGTSLNISNTIKAKIKNFMLNSTELTQDGTPSPSSPVDVNVIKGENNVKVENKNLLNFTFTNSFTKNGITFTKNNDGSLTLNGTATTTFSQVLNITHQTLKGTYTIKHNVLGGTTSASSYMSIQKSPSENISDRVYGGTGSSTYDITTDTTIITASLYITSGTTFTDYNVGSQLEEGSTATEYVEHQEQNYPISLGNLEYCKIGDYVDQFFKNTIDSEFYDSTLLENEWYLKKNIGKIDSYNGETITTSYISTTGGLDTGATVYYGLATPTYIHISQTEYPTLKGQLDNLYNNAKSYNGQTNITQTNDDLPFNISVDVKVKTE